MLRILFPYRVTMKSRQGLNGRLQYWTHSRLACVAGLRAVAALPSPGTRLRDCAALADTILAETAKTATHPDGYWQRGPDDPRPDAALLLPALRGPPAARGPRRPARLRPADRGHPARRARPA